ncbi:hypothetical protein C8R46DRAFT_1291954 [Mycena filopes]|nr:hypothetical protein C8R46DRAFT_1291954 [Mycena filopes]
MLKKIDHLDDCAAQERDASKKIIQRLCANDCRSREFQLNDSAVSYFNSKDRIADQGILRSPVKATGIVWAVFKHLGLALAAAKSSAIQYKFDSPHFLVDIFIELQSNAHV